MRNLLDLIAFGQKLGELFSSCNVVGLALLLEGGSALNSIAGSINSADLDRSFSAVDLSGEVLLDSSGEFLLSDSTFLDTRFSLSSALAFLDSQVVVVLEDFTGGLDSVSSVALDDERDSAGDGSLISVKSAFSESRSDAVGLSNLLCDLSVGVTELENCVGALFSWSSSRLANFGSENSAGRFHGLNNLDSDSFARSLDLSACNSDVSKASLVALLESGLGLCSSAVADSLCIGKSNLDISLSLAFLDNLSLTSALSLADLLCNSLDGGLDSLVDLSVDLLLNSDVLLDDDNDLFGDDLDVSSDPSLHIHVFPCRFS